MRRTTWWLAASITLGASAVAGAGANAGQAGGPTSALASAGRGMSVNSNPWARWQARLLFGTAAPAWESGLATQDGFGSRPGRLSLLGDYYLSAPAAGGARASGLRATGGVLLGPRARPWIGPALAPDYNLTGQGRMSGTGLIPSAAAARDTFGDSAALPYVGVGYMALPSRSGSGSGWSFGADLGLVAQNPGSAGLALGRGKSLDDTVRQLRLTPLFQVGVSYSF